MQLGFYPALARAKGGGRSIVELTPAQLAMTVVQIANDNALYCVLVQQPNLNYQTRKISRVDAIMDPVELLRVPGLI